MADMENTAGKHSSENVIQVLMDAARNPKQICVLHPIYQA
jgi:hypothetical protein